MRRLSPRRRRASLIVEFPFLFPFLSGKTQSTDLRIRGKTLVQVAGSLTSVLCTTPRHCHQPFHGSTTSIPQSSKSPTLRVASLDPRTWANAAICASAWLMGMPRARRAAPILANTLAASLSKTKTRPAKSSLNIPSAVANNLSRRLPRPKKLNTVKTSASVTNVVKSSVSGCCATQVKPAPMAWVS